MAKSIFPHSCKICESDLVLLKTDSIQIAPRAPGGRGRKITTVLAWCRHCRTVFDKDGLNVANLPVQPVYKTKKPSEIFEEAMKIYNAFKRGELKQVDPPKRKSAGCGVCECPSSAHTTYESDGKVISSCMNCKAVH